MVRKRRGEPGQAAVASLPSLALLLLLLCLDVASCYTRVGCTFSKSICIPGIEDCYDDNAFGRCLRLDDSMSDEDWYQYDLVPEELDLLRMELEKLEYLGYQWTDDYTQCVMQILLHDVRYRTNNDVEDLCKHLRLRGDVPYNEENQLIDKEATGNLRNDEMIEGEEGEPVAVVKFTPSEINPHGEFADEFYYPPDADQPTDEQVRKVALDLMRSDQRYLQSNMREKAERPADIPGAVYRRGSRSLNNPTLSPLSIEPFETPEQYIQALYEFYDSKSKFYPYNEDDVVSMKNLKANDDIIDKYNLYNYNNNNNNNNGDDDDDDDGEVEENYEKTFSKKYKQPKEVHSVDLDSNDDYDSSEGEEDEEGDKADYDFLDGNSAPKQSELLKSGLFDSLTRRGDRVRPAGTHEKTDDLNLSFDGLTRLVWEQDSGFKRIERLDVKKPGPSFSVNNYAFEPQSPSTSKAGSNSENSKEVVEVVHPPVKKEMNAKFDSSVSNSIENVDLDHVYIQFKQDINSWSEGNKIVQLVGELIGLKPGELTGIRVGRAEVTFKVSKNSKNYNVTDVINKIVEIRDDLKKQLQVDVYRAGIGDKTKLPALVEVEKVKPDISSSLFGTMFIVGLGLGCAAAVLILIIANWKARPKVPPPGRDPEAPRVYQELCRARMAAKQPEKSGESPKGFDFGRLIESGRSESRSSTSSWTEEPPSTNIDVATGHLVLSYMEDHLKNQEKLDEEWTALCAYEAEPCSTAVAEGNADHNRPGAALPYDHSRVILNDLANLKSSDYINASTITDHDPRNPAYIATQGPLPQTTADFWQLVWEQGSVVIVMLTRLTEEGQAMCHRYWPDEGSETYHLYEIHIVSEHVWCEDYLVRSFYLKNLRTGETRTVTQFHFLSWPNNAVPKSTKALLEFRRKVNKSYRGRSCPIIVHCSDGAGRTGTYCLIDMLLNRMSKGAKEIDLAATLEHIRDQRPGMVATKQQFEFVLMAVAEEVHAILKTLPAVADKPAAAAATASADKQAPTKSDK